MTGSIRLFIAIELPEAIYEPVEEAIATVRQMVPEKAIRWVESNNLHLTLKFLGESPISLVRELERALESAAAGHTAFDVEIEGAGCFPTIAKPRVLWLGLEDPKKRLKALFKDIEHVITPLGYKAEKRPFSPHLTIGRVKRHVKGTQLLKVGEGINRTMVTKVATWHCDAVSLMQSDLRREGPVYTQLAHVSL